METDIPLRTLTAACAPDLLPLLGTPDAEVLGVESLELPATASRLDSLLRLRDRRGRVYLHLIEWQGYRDPRFLWRVLTYLGWLGMHRQERPLAVSLIYLNPAADAGDTVREEVDGHPFLGASFHCVRLWEQDAAAAVGSGRPGLAVLSPLMGGATAALVEAAADVVLAEATDRRRQADLLSVLGVLAEPLVAPSRFVALMGREQLMKSELLDLLLREKMADLEEERARERAQLEEERARERTQLEEERAELAAALAQAVEAVIAARFPMAPMTLALSLHRIQRPPALRELLSAVLQAPDLATVQQLVESAATA